MSPFALQLDDAGSTERFTTFRSREAHDREDFQFDRTEASIDLFAPENIGATVAQTFPVANRQLADGDHLPAAMNHLRNMQLSLVAIDIPCLMQFALTQLGRRFATGAVKPKYLRSAYARPSFVMEGIGPALIKTLNCNKLDVLLNGS